MELQVETGGFEGASWPKIRRMAKKKKVAKSVRFRTNLRPSLSDILLKMAIP